MPRRPLLRPLAPCALLVVLVAAPPVEAARRPAPSTVAPALREAASALASGVAPATLRAEEAASVARRRPLPGRALRPYVRRDGRLQVQVEARPGHDVAGLAAPLRAAGATVQRLRADARLVQALLDPARLDELGRDPRVAAVRPPAYAIPQIGSVTTAGDGAVDAPAARRSRGGGGYSALLGRPVRVGVVSDGVAGLDRSVLSGDLPANVTVRSFVDPPGDATQDGNCSPTAEGRAMLEIVHDLVPDAQLLAAAVETDLDYLDAVAWLASETDVIVDDIAFFNAGPYDGTSAVARVRTDASTGGTTYVAAVGNSGEQHHRSSFVPGTLAANDAVFSPIAHRFPNGSFRLPVRVAAGSGALVFLQWDDPDFEGATDFDLVAFRAPAGNDFATFSATTQEAGRAGERPTEELLIENPSGAARDFWLQIEYCGPTSGDRCTAGNVPAVGSRTFRLFVVGDGVIPASDRVRAGSIPNGPDAPGIITVGAFCISDGPFCGGDGEVERFSSAGATNPNDASIKPTLVGPDGVRTTVNEVAGLGGDGLFFGTSAAAPHVAAVAAMVIAATDAAPDAVRQQLVDSATAIGSPVPNTLAGYGGVEADAALSGLVGVGVAAAATLAAGATPADGQANPADPGVVLLEAVVTNTHAADPLRLVALGVTAAATSGHERSDLARACVEADGLGRLGCGLVDGRFDADDGRLLVQFDPPRVLDPGQSMTLRVVYDLAVRPAGTAVTASAGLMAAAAAALAVLVLIRVGRRRGAALAAALVLAACGGDDGGGAPGMLGCPPVLAAAAERLPASAAFTLQPLQPGDVLGLRGATVVVPTGAPVPARSVTVPRP
jgi:hypothetical protein